MQAQELLLPEGYLTHFDALNRIVKQSGVNLEGNLYYDALQPDPRRDNVCKDFARKRHNFRLFCGSGHSLLEIGFNAGHSALLALAQGVDYHGIDWCYYPYTRPAAAYMREQFGDRFTLHEGNSLEMVAKVPTLHVSFRFDLFHIDGHTGLDYVRSDTLSAIKVGLRRSWILVDDTDLPHIRNLYNELISSGQFLPEKPAGWQDTHYHTIGRLP